MSMQQTLRTRASARSSSVLRPFSHLLLTKTKSPRDSGPDDSVDQDEKDAGPTEDVGDEGDAGPDKKNDKLKNKPVADEGDGDDDDEDEDAEDAADEAGEEEVAKARKAGFSKALKATARAAACRERLRCSAIFQSGHASGRIEMAANLAFSTQLSAADAIAELSRAPRERTAPTA